MYVVNAPILCLLVSSLCKFGTAVRINLKHFMPTEVSLGCIVMGPVCTYLQGCGRIPHEVFLGWVIKMPLISIVIILCEMFVH